MATILFVKIAMLLDMSRLSTLAELVEGEDLLLQAEGMFAIPDKHVISVPLETEEMVRIISYG